MIGINMQTFSRWTHPIIVVLSMVAAIVAVADSDLQLLYPDNNVSSKPVLEFRARSGLPGHAFVLVGRELDNGLTHFYAAAGFYPEGNGMKSVKNILNGPGQVTFKLADGKSDQVFRVDLDASQVEPVLRTISAWDEKRYHIWSQNCVDLNRAVATVIGLNVPSKPSKVADAKDEYPPNFIENLRKSNARDSAVKHAAEVRQRAEQEQRQKQADTARSVEAAKKAVEAAQAAQRQQEQIAQARKAIEDAERARRAAEAANYQPPLPPVLPPVPPPLPPQPPVVLPPPH